MSVEYGKWGYAITPEQVEERVKQIKFEIERWKTILEYPMLSLKTSAFIEGLEYALAIIVGPDMEQG